MLRRLLHLTAVWVALHGTSTPSFAGPFLTDPVGDTFGIDTVKHDITGVHCTHAGGVLTFEVFFRDPVEPPFNLAARSVVGFLDLDTDQNPSTAGPGQRGTYGPGFSGLGAEYYVDLFSGIASPDQVDVVDTASGLAVGSATLTFAPSGLSFSLAIPLTLLGGDDGTVNFGLVAGTFADASDDIVGIAPAAAVPEPGSLVALAITLAVAGAARATGKASR